MNQRAIFFVAIVCIAQLGVTLVRNFWSEQSRRVQHISLAQSTSLKHVANLPVKAALASPSKAESAVAAPAQKTETLTVSQDREVTPKVESNVSPPTVRDEKPKSQLSDPFVPFFSIRKEGQDDPNRPLSTYDIAELRLTAVISDAQGNRVASVETPQGRDFLIKEGSSLGIRGGRVTTILPSKVIVTEPSRKGTDRGAPVERELSLKVPPSIQPAAHTF